MLFKNAAVGLVACLVGAHATPVARDTNLVLLSSQAVPDGNLTIWGVADAADTVAQRDAVFVGKRACGTNDVSCSSDHRASTTVCNMLFSNIAANSGSGVSLSPRSICLTSSGDQCCVSWADPVNGLTQGELIDAATKISQVCSSGGSVSGLARNVDLNGVCTTQCVSNRATGCTN